MPNLLDFLPFGGKRRARRLYAEGRELIDKQQYDAAMKIAGRLRELRYSGAYELEGLACQGLDRNEDAVHVLREGLAIAPNVWLNWLLLGSCLSNLGRYDEALAAYDRAEECPHGDPSVIHLNRAVVALRKGEPARSLEFLEQVHTHPVEAGGARVAALRALGRNQEAEETAMRILSDWQKTDRTAARNDIGEIALMLCEIRRERGEDSSALRAFAIDYWRATHCESLLWLIRDLDLRTSPRAQYFRLTLAGRVAPSAVKGFGAAGFWMSADAVADTAEEALAFVLELKPPEPDVEVSIEKAEAMEPRPEGPKGVYATTGRVFYRK